MKRKKRSKLTVGKNVVIHKNVVFGDDVVINDNAVIGRQPSLVSSPWTKVKEAVEPLVIGDRVVIGTGAIIYAGCCLGNDVFVADLVAMRENVHVGDGAIIGRGVTVEHGATIGEGTVVSTGAHVGTECVLRDRVVVGPNACVISANREDWAKENRDTFAPTQAHPPVLEEGVFVGTNATIIGGVTIGERAAIGAGAVVIKDIPADEMWGGVPARCLKGGAQK